MSNADPNQVSSDEPIETTTPSPAPSAPTQGTSHTVSAELKRRNRKTGLIILAGVLIYIGIGMFRSWLSAQ